MRLNHLAVPALLLATGAASALAQWNPAARQWGKTDPDDLRVLTFNVQDRICSTNNKLQGANTWTAIAVQIAALKPDVVILQECGDNSANGTGNAQGYNTVDTVQRLTDTLNYLMRGGTDAYVNGNPTITSYVTKFATPGYDLPFVYVSDQTDNFNRNAVLSRFPLADLNGDGRSSIGTFNLVADSLAPWYSAGNGGIRGFIFSEINLPDDRYGGDLVFGGAHLKSGSNSSDFTERLQASQRIAYYIDAIFNGLGGTSPDPRTRSTAFPRPNKVLTAKTPVIWGGDFNEDEYTNGSDGPTLWMTRAQSISPATDGTDRDRSDSSFDDSRDPFNTGLRLTIGNSGNTKFDYICWQDSIATLRRSFVFRASTMPGSATPTEFTNYPSLYTNISGASDHKPVVADFILPLPDPASGHNLVSPADASVNLGLSQSLTWTLGQRVTDYTVVLSTNSDLSSPILSQTVASVGPATLSVPANLLSYCGTYYWTVRANNRSGAANSPSGIWSFRVRGQTDLNADGFVDDTDFVIFAGAYEELVTSVGDFNDDGFTDDSDFVIFAAAYNALLACP
ncbi:MAG TPA: endonuclease/exonuclease/phosphatase family protein [Phycisphaerales bacterium]